MIFADFLMLERESKREREREREYYRNIYLLHYVFYAYHARTYV